MAIAAEKIQIPAYEETREPAPAKASWLNTAAVPLTGDSPAIDLQRRVAEAFEAPDGRWSPRKTLVFTVGVCSAFWACVALAVYAAVN
jgi:hypothetical protein